MGIGTQMIGAIIICAWIGNKLDTYFQTETPYLTLLMMMFGVFASLALLMKQLKNDR